MKFLENKNETHLTKLLRVDAVKWACDTEYEPFKTHATEKFNLWLKEAKNVNTYVYFISYSKIKFVDSEYLTI